MTNVSMSIEDDDRRERWGWPTFESDPPTRRRPERPIRGQVGKDDRVSILGFTLSRRAH
jgi:hypothetical protein